MPFYGQRGDFYQARGDFYRGDPWIGAALKGARWLGKAFKRTVGGAARSGALGLVRSRTAQEIARDLAVGTAGYTMGRRSAQQGPGTSMIPAGSDTDVERSGGGVPWYVNRRRKMNPLNPKALRRALRRAEGFEKFAARTVNALYRVVDGRRTRTFKKRSK